MNLIGSSAFCFEIPGDILLQCLQNQYHLTELYCLSNISPSIEADRKLANLSFVFALNIFSFFLLNYRVIKKSITKLHFTN